FAQKGGKSAEEIAGILGWNDAETMVQALAQAQPRKQLLGQEVQNRLEALYGPTLLDDPQRLAGEAIRAANNPAAVRKAVLELNALRRALLKETKEAMAPAQAELNKLKEQTAEQRKVQKQEDQRTADQRRKLLEELRRPFNLEGLQESTR